MEECFYLVRYMGRDTFQYFQKDIANLLRHDLKETDQIHIRSVHDNASSHNTAQQYKDKVRD